MRGHHHSNYIRGPLYGALSNIAIE
jgi:hypothetical protein